VIVVVVTSLGGEPPRPPAPTATSPHPPAPPAPPDTRGLRTGLTESNPNLLATGAVPPAFTQRRDQAAALRPAYFRLLVDWSRVQPRGDVPPDWTAPSDGCMRGAPPCGPSSGIRDLLRAVRERQRADGGWQVVVVLYGTPDWARRGGQAGCGADLRPDLDAYRALVRSLAGLGRQEGVALRWWSPWNEPNHPTFLGPQRAACERDAQPLSPGEYAGIARALQGELRTVEPGARLVLGEVAGYDRARPRAVGAAEFARDLPRDVACAGDVWAQHAYVRATDDVPAGDGGDEGSPSLAGDAGDAGDPALLRDVLAALDSHGCPRPHRLWITETGVGGPRTGEERPADAATDRRGCEAMDAALRAWAQDPRVDAAFQYTFREDSAFPVGLSDPSLSRLYRAYTAWADWGTPGPAPARADCAAAPPG
jgi:hypothetical protein